MKNFTLIILVFLFFSNSIAFSQSNPASPLLQNQPITTSQAQELLNANRDINQSTDSGEQNVNDRFKDYAEDEEDDDEIRQLTFSNSLNNRFGLSIFKNRVSTFSPIDNLPVPDDYKLGTGDQLNIQLLGTENIQLTPTISRDGSIFINRIGEIILAGLLFDEASELIKSRIETALIGVQVFVTMGRIKTINIFISGEVAKPGMYSLSALTSVTQSLYQAGGITNIGSLRNIQVLRKGKIINEFDAYDLLIYGNASNDIRLRSGDVLFVPPFQGIVSIEGNVKRKSIYEIKESDTFADLLKWSGGYDESANPQFGLLIRSNEIGSLPSSYTLDFTSDQNKNIELVNNDKISIPSIGNAVFNTGIVSGAINRPGQIGWFDGMKLSDIFTNINEDFSELFDPNFSYIERFNSKLQKWEIIYFAPIDILESPSSKANLELLDNDYVVVLYNNSSRYTQIASTIKKFQDQSSNNELSKIINITGAVKYPGPYPIFNHATLSDMFKAAGGFKDNALIGSIEVSRSTLIADGLVVPSVEEISALSTNNEADTFFPQSRDRVHVRTIKELNSSETITLSGQVKYPGVYPLNSDDTLKSIIHRAGGLLDDAFVDGAFLQRQSTMESQKKGNYKLAQTIRSSHAASMLTSEENMISFSEIEAVAEVIENIANDGRVVIQLDKALEGNENFNFALDPGDNLYIPRKASTVSVIGEVNASNSNMFDPRLSVKDYISLSGGFTARANKKNIYIIKANGSILPLSNSLVGFGLKKPNLSAGDTIVVPVQSTYTDRLSLWGKVTQIIYQSLVSIATLDRITRD